MEITTGFNGDGVLTGGPYGGNIEIMTSGGNTGGGGGPGPGGSWMVVLVL